MRIKIIISLIFLCHTLFCVAKGNHEGLSCPVSRYIDFSDAQNLVNRFRGDTIFFSIPNAENAVFETFKYVTPDTIWLKERPHGKLPKEHKHYELLTNFKGEPGWGVNAHREYTYGRSLEGNYFVLQDYVVEEIPYLGKFPLIILEDVLTGKFIKWEFRKNENENILIFSPSIRRHLEIIKGNDLYIEQTDSTAVLGRCVNVGYSVKLHNKKFIPLLSIDFFVEGKKVSTSNWTPRFFIRKEYENKIHQ